MSSRLSHYLWRCFVVPHADESAVPQFTSVGPLDEGDLAKQLRLDPATLLHLFGGESFAPTRGLLLGEIGEWAVVNDPLFELRKNLVANARDESVAHLCHEGQSLLFVNADDQRVEPMRARDVAADDELLLLHVRAELDPGAWSRAGFVDGIDQFSYDTFQAEFAHGLENLTRWRPQQRREAQRILERGEEASSNARRWEKGKFTIARRLRSADRRLKIGPMLSAIWNVQMTQRSICAGFSGCFACPSMDVLGGGVIGSEFARLFNGLGVKTTLVGVSCGTLKQIPSFIFLPIAKCWSNGYPGHSGAKSQCA